MVRASDTNSRDQRFDPSWDGHAVRNNFLFFLFFLTYTNPDPNPNPNQNEISQRNMSHGKH